MYLTTITDRYVIIYTHYMFIIMILTKKKSLFYKILFIILLNTIIVYLHVKVSHDGVAYVCVHHADPSSLVYFQMRVMYNMYTQQLQNKRNTIIVKWYHNKL